jgi:hypothetical protein
MRIKTLAHHLVIASLFVGPLASVAVAHTERHARHARGVPARSFASDKPLYGYYSRHGQYVPGAGDRLMYGPGYAFVPGRGILDEACNLPTSTCPNEYRDIQ